MIPRLPRAAAWLLTVTYVVGALVWLTGAPAAAHASLLSTDPDDGAVVAQTPGQVVFTFNEPVRLDDGAVHAFRANGTDWQVSAEAQDNRVVVTPDEDPGTGTVVVAWQVVSSDGHKVSGALTFSIGAASSNGPTTVTPEAPTSVTALRLVATSLAGLGLLLSIGLALTGRTGGTPHLIWNVGLGAAVLLAPLHQLADEGRGLGGLGDWLTWLDGMTRGSSLLLLGAYAAAALARSVPSRVLVVTLTVPTLVLLGGAAYFWPQSASPPSSAVPATSAAAATTVRGDLGGSGSVEITVTREAGRTVTLDLKLRDTQGRPLKPFAAPTLTVSNNQLSLGDATLTKTGPGAYHSKLTIPTDGAWSASVSVRTSEFDNPVAAVPFIIS